VPNHLKDASRDAEGFGHGEGYLYPHAYRDHWVSQQYLPDALVGRVFYTPSTQGYEKTIYDDVLARRELQIASLLEQSEDFISLSNSSNLADSKNKKTNSKNSEKTISLKKSSEENLTFTPVDKAKENALHKADRVWRERIDSNKAETLLEIRNTILESALLLRHHRSLIWNVDDGLLLWEVLRKTPEGVTCGVCKSIDGKNILEQYARTLNNLDKPILYVNEKDNLFESFKKIFYDGIIFDRLFFYNPFVSKKSITDLIKSINKIIQKNDKRNFSFTDYEEEEITFEMFSRDWKIIIAQRIPSSAQFISDIIENQILKNASHLQYKSALKKMRKAEVDFFSASENDLFNWDEDFIEEELLKSGYFVNLEKKVFVEKRKIYESDIDKWFSKESSSYGAKIFEALGDAEVEKLLSLLKSACERSIFDWKTTFAFFTISPKNLLA
ncbi:MAG: recombinase RarA, partial [Treponema sp.]|nr:recombinase RarA [Treponema sp.]